MNTTDPSQEGWAGRQVMDAAGPSGSYDLPSEGVYSGLTRLARKVTGSGIKHARQTPDLVSEGKAAKANPLSAQEQETLGTIADPAATPTGSDVPQQPQEPATPDYPDNPAGITSRDADAAITNTTAPPGEDATGKATQSVDPVQYAKDVEAAKGTKLVNRDWARNINLDYINNPEDLGAVLEVNAAHIPEAAHKSFAETRGQVDGKHMEIMGEVLKDTSNPQALTDVQLLAGREILLGLVEQVNDLAVKINTGKAVDEDKVKFDIAQQKSIALQKFMQGSIRETARALNSMKIVAQAVNSGDAQSIATLADSGNHALRAKQLLDMQKEGASAADVITKAEEMSKIKKLTSALVNLRNASILTGAKTQAVNFISNSFYGTLTTLVVKPTAAGIGFTRQAANMGGPERVFLAEVGAELAGFQQGFRDSMMMGKDLWIDGTFSNKGEYVSSFDRRAAPGSGGGTTRKIDEAVDDSPMVGDAISDIIPGARKTGIPQVANAWQRVNESIAYGLLSASDEFFKSISYRKSLYSQAVRAAYMDETVPEAQVQDKVNDLLNNITKDMHDNAILYAEDMTFTNRENISPVLAVFADALVKGGQMFPPLRLIVPFVRTPIALFDRTIKFSPLAVLQKEFRDRVKAGGADGDMAMSELGLGITLMSGMLALYANGDLTGNGPADYKQKKVLEKSGWQRNSVRLPNGTYVSIARGLDPIASPLMAVASYMDQMYYAKEEMDALEIATGSIFALAKHFKDNTYMQGISDAIGVIEGRKNWPQFAASQVSGYVPALMRDAASLARGMSAEEGVPSGTPRVPSSNQFWDMLRQQIKNRVPGTEPESVQRYWDGTVATAGGGEMMFLYNSVSPIRLSREQGTKGRDVDYSNNELIRHIPSVVEPSPRISLESGQSGTKSGVGLNLLNDIQHGAALYDKLLEEVGGARREAVDARVDSKQYNNSIDYDDGSNPWKEKWLEEALAVGLKEGQKRFLSWLSEQELDPEFYGENIQALDKDTMKSLVGDWKKGILTTDEEGMLGKLGGKGLSRNRAITPPQYVPNI